MRNGFEDNRPCTLERLPEARAGCKLERHLRGVNGVVLPIVNGDLDVHNREPMNAAFEHRLDDTFLDRRNEPSWDRPALHAINEFETIASRCGTERKMADAVLAMATRLLLVFALSICRSRDRLPVRNAYLLLVDLNAEFTLELLDRCVHVVVAKAVEEGLVGLGVAFESERGIFFKDPVEGSGELVII